MSRKNYTEREKAKLLAVVNKYKYIIDNKATNAFTVQKKKDAWQKIALEYNPGAEYPRTEKQLITAYSNMKRIRRPNVADENPKEDVVFATVKQACMDLVQMHGHPISLIDDEAFQSLIQLMPLTTIQKARITAEYIQKCLDSPGEEYEAEMSFQEDRDASDNDEETTERGLNVSNPKETTIKGEIEEVPCNCSARLSDEATKNHELGCPAAAKQPYWNYFEVKTDEATCQICHLTLSLTNITKLKEHLAEKHPNVEYVDDFQDEEFTRGPASDVWSHEEAEEVYLEDDLDADPLPPPSAKKRKRASDRLKSMDERPAKEKTREERVREMRQEREGLSEANRRVIELAPDRFKSLDSFGQYVAELMKLIPKDKCLKYQVQIVQRLLQEQAAAG